VKLAMERLARCTRGAITLSMCQLFLGALTIGIGLCRGTEVYAAFHMEEMVGFANFSASKTAADHARSANVVVANNQIMAGIMGPRFGVDSDCLTMDANAEMACPQCPKGPLCKVCMQYKANIGRCRGKQAWVDGKQKVIWGLLGKLSGEVDSLAFQQVKGIIEGEIRGIDSQVQMRIDDPSQYGSIWGGGNAGVACDLAMNDILPSPVAGHAFAEPQLLNPNLLAGLPKALIQIMPRMICAVAGALQSAMSGGGGGGGGSHGDPALNAIGAQIPSIGKQTQNDCNDLENQMRCTIDVALGSPGSCGDYFSAPPQITDATAAVDTIQFPSPVQQYVTCQTASPDAPLRNLSQSSGYSYRSKNGIVTCTFDRDKCMDKQMTKNSDDYVRAGLGLSAIASIANLAASLGGSETRGPSQEASNPKNFCATAYAQKSIPAGVVQLSDAYRKICSFGLADQGEALRKRREYRAAGYWYFPDKEGEYSSTEVKKQPFVGAWKYAQATECQGGGGV
jgi:hypothetical protein